MRSSFNFEVLKFPRGFIKCIEIFLAIFAFSCATGYRGSFTILQEGSKVNHPVEGTFKYPFNTPIVLRMMKNDSKEALGYKEVKVEIPLDEKSSTEFFVVIGVFCFLYSLGVLIYYVAFEEDTPETSAPTNNYRSPAVIDFVAGAFWAFFWFVSACAQAAAVNRIKDATNANDLSKSLMYCKSPYSCSVEHSTKFATLTVSILLGFLNAFVWGGNMWFLWKETPWHAARNRPQASNIEQPPPQPQPVPSAI